MAAPNPALAPVTTMVLMVGNLLGTSWATDRLVIEPVIGPDSAGGGLRPGGGDRRRQGLQVERPVVPLPVDEERRRARGAADIRRFHVLGDAGGVRVGLEFVVEAVDVEAELTGVAQQVRRLELVLVG